MSERGGDEARAIADKFWTGPDATVMEAHFRVCIPLYNPPRDNGASTQTRRFIQASPNWRSSQALATASIVTRLKKRKRCSADF